MIRVVLLIIMYFVFHTISVAQEYHEEKPLIHINMDDIIILPEYEFQNVKEEIRYKKLESDLRVIHPLIVIVRKEYERINKELILYNGEKEKEFLKWYEKYAKENYMHYLSGLNTRQGRLFLKLIDRELNETPYELLKTYRNGFRAILWQSAAYFFGANLKANYEIEENPMIEHIMNKLDLENQYNI